MGVDQDDATGQYNEFWSERDYREGTLGTAEDVTASVFVVHGLQDTNVKTRHSGEWWEALGAAGVDRKMWLLRPGHVDPFDTDRQEWVHELHRWFDSELMDIGNGILDEPAVRSEVAPREFAYSDSWPVARITPRLQPQADGGLVLGRSDSSAVSFVNDPGMTEAAAVTADGEGRRLLFGTGAMKQDVRLSGKPVLDLTVSHDAPQGQVAVYLVDYGTADRVSTSGDGIRTLSTQSCWGESTSYDDACFRDTELNISSTPLQVLARGWARLEGPGTHELSVELHHNDVLLERGHQLGLVVAGASRGRVVTVDNRTTTYTVDLADTELHLPMTGPLAGFTRGAIRLPHGDQLPAGTIAPATERERPGR